MKKLEAKFQTLFNHWLKADFLPDHMGGYAFELKHTRGRDYLPFSDVQDHQLAALLAANGEGIIHKISDESRSYKPFDCFILRRCDAYVVVKYPDFFVLIPVKKFIAEKKRSKSKSLDCVRATKIAWLTVRIPPIHFFSPT